MSNNLRSLEKRLRSFIKRSKEIKYTKSLLFTFLMTGGIAQAIGKSDENNSINGEKKQLVTSIDDMKDIFKEARKENNKLIKGANLELVKLMEQGDHVVKSPWSSWQFGVNYFYNNWGGRYKGYGGKTENIKYNRGMTSDLTKYTANTSNGNYNSTSLDLISTYEPKSEIGMFATINPRVIQKIDVTVAEKSVANPQVPETVEFNPVKPEIPVLNPPAVNVTAISLSAIWNSTGLDTLGLNSNATTPGTYEINNTTPARNQNDPSTHSPSATTRIAETFIDIGVAGTGGTTKTYTIGPGLTLNIKRNGVRAGVVDAGDWGRADVQKADIVNKGTINLYNETTGGLEIQGNPLVGIFSAINEGDINGLGNKQLGLTMTPEQPNATGSMQTFENRGKINLAGNESTGINIVNRKLYASTENAGLRATYPSGFYNDVVIKALNSAGGTITLGGTGSYGIAFGAYGNDSRLSENTEFKNDGTINVNNDTSGGIAVKKANDWVGTRGNAVLENGASGTITIKGKDSFGIYSEEVSGTNKGTISIEGSKDKAIGLRANKTGTLIPVLKNENKIDIASTGKHNIGLFTDNAKVINDNAGKVNITAGENIGMAVYGTGEGENKGSISATSDGSIGLMTSDTGKITNTGSVTVSGGNTATSGTYGIVTGQGSTVDSTGGTLTVNVNGDKSLGVYSNGTLKIGNSTINASDGAVNFYSDNNGNIEIASGKTVNTTTGSKSLLFYNGNAGTGRVLVNGTLNAVVQGGTDATNRGTAFYYIPGALSSAGSVSGYNNSISYGSFLTGDIQNYFNTNFGGTLGNANLNMQNGSRLFVASNVKMNLSNTAAGALSGLTGAPVITGSDYKTFMMYLSELKVDAPVNLDSATDSYNQLEISNSSIINENTISGTAAGQAAIAQKNKNSNKNYVTLVNETAGNINLAGANSIGIFAENGNIINRGNITLGGTAATALFGTANSLMSNEGSINLNGTGNTGMFFENTSSTPSSEVLRNSGTITSTQGESAAMIYKPGNILTAGTTLVNNTGTITMAGDKNTGIYALKDTGNAGYVIENNGTIEFSDDSASINNDSNVGIYTNGENNKVKTASGSKIETKARSIGIYGYEVENDGDITVGDSGVGIYSLGKNINVNSGTIKVGNNNGAGIYMAGTNQTLTAGNAANMVIGNGSVGIMDSNTSTPGNTIISNIANIGLGDNSAYIYSAGANSNIINTSNITSAAGSAGRNFGIYSAGNVVNSGNIDFRNGEGNVGIYVDGSMGNAINSGNITVGKSDTATNAYSIGMGAKNGASIENTGVINVIDENGVGMYASGAGSKAINRGDINLSGSSSVGMYIDDYAVGENYGNIQTTAGPNGDSIIGVYTLNNGVIKNYGTININSEDGIGVYLGRNSRVEENGGSISASGTNSERIYVSTGSDTSKGVKGIEFKLPYPGAPSASVIRDGSIVTPVTLDTNIPSPAANIVTVGATSINLTNEEMSVENNGGGKAGLGMYVDTSGVNYTNPISGLQHLSRLKRVNLIFGTEASKYTNSKDILLGDNIIAPYNTAISQVNATNPTMKWQIYSGSLSWIATATQDPVTNELKNVYLSKIPYTSFAKDTDSYNFMSGLEERYGVEGTGTREKAIYDKLNELGKGEAGIFAQAVDEMKGHQYANTQQRIYETGNSLDKEFRYLKNEWRNPSKQNNKIKVFGMKDEYNTNTAGIHDYRSNAYGVAYVHEDETVKLGHSSGWYAGAVTNRFKFKDLGGSKEDQTMLKLGIFKTMSPLGDHNGNLRWTISGDIFGGINHINRKFWVVDDVFGAKGTYYSYGAALKNELGYDIRMSERTHLRPYGMLKMEYGRFTDIKEKSGEMRLEVAGNDYFSVKPEVGVEFKYVQPLAVRTQLSVELSAAYENELGKIQNRNQAKVGYTSAGWYNLEKEKEDRRGNGKFDLNIGIDNTRFGVTVNAGYDTKGSNIRGGIGFRAIY